MKMTQEVDNLERLNGQGTIADEDLDDLIQKVRTKYQPRIDKLAVLASKKEDVECKILLEGDRVGSESSTFVIELGKTHIAAEVGIKLLSDPIHGIFQRSGKLVRLVRYRRPKPKKTDIVQRPDGAIQISDVDETFLIQKLGILRSWEKYDSRSKKSRPIDFPSLAAKMILGDRGQSFPFLRGFINCPTIRLDGTLLDQPGYDEETGLFLDPDGIVFPKIPEHPTKDQAIESLAVLTDILQEFPFEDEVSRSVMLTEMMTAVIRRVLPVAPLFANDAPAAASGKTLLAKLPSYIATGRASTLISPSRNEEELRKRLAAVLMKGDLVLCLDNVDFPLESRDLCIVSTTEIWNERILGESRQAEIETNSQIIITGNNLSLVGDLCTRVLRCRLVPLVDHPEDRKFNRDLNVYVPANRGVIVAAILTIMRAYIVSGCQCHNEKGFREYTHWCRLVRGSLLWLDCADPCVSIRRVQEQDPKRAEIEALFGVLNAFPADSFTAKQIVDKALNSNHRNENEDVQELCNVLTMIASKKDGCICSTRLGCKFREFKDRICNGKRLVEVGKDRTNKTIWKLANA